VSSDGVLEGTTTLKVTLGGVGMLIVPGILGKPFGISGGVKLGMAGGLNPGRVTGGIQPSATNAQVTITIKDSSNLTAEAG